MIKLIWSVLIWVSVPCENNSPPPDPYTGQPSNMSYAVNCGRYENKEMSREFSTEKEADEFISHAPDYLKDSFQKLESRPRKESK